LHIYRKLGAQNVEPADAYFFSASLYVSQTRELPILSANAYAHLHELLNGLIGYPHNDATVPRRRPELRARCVRAGLGVSRTLFSIGVVARFDDLGGIRVPLPPRPGYFEHHRLTLRWMLREATRLDPSLAAPHQWNPYYPDEIVWLFNECGVFSLAQGQSFDAVMMLESALAAARGIEGDGNTPIRRRILLNLGVCAINRGRPNEARRLLEEVKREPTEDETLVLIAEGYLALLDHLGGAHDSAVDVYNRVIKRLIALGRSRPVSLFLRNRGDLHRYKRDFKAATEDFSAAIDYARRGGSEDMAWFAMVSKARLDIALTVEFKHVAKTLEDAERYADAMELHMLKAEVCFVHGQILLRQGETALAAEKASQALRIATLHGLVLRAIAYRSLLADIHRERGWLEASRRMKGQVLQAARSAGYRVLLQRHATETGPDSENLGGAEYLPPPAR
jgi:tetratricopeptide (TPR) repeat protein